MLLICSKNAGLSGEYPFRCVKRGSIHRLAPEPLEAIPTASAANCGLDS